MKEFLGLPIDAAAHGGDIDQMIGVVHWLMFVLFAGWGSFFIYTLYRFRRRAQSAANYTGVRTHVSSYLEAGLAVFEVVLLVGFAFPLWSARVTEFPPDDTATVVRVVAEQFIWNIHYPGADGEFGTTIASLVSAENPIGLDRTDPSAKDDIVSVNQMNLPVNKPVIVRLTTKDVIHSFGLPLFRVKQDAIPGETVRLWFTPTMTTAEIRDRLVRRYSLREGVLPRELQGPYSAAEDYADKDGNVIVGKGYSFSEEAVQQLTAAGIFDVKASPDSPPEIACAQLCGLGHYRMRGFVTVQTQGEFDQWMKEQEAMIPQDVPAETAPQVQ